MQALGLLSSGNDTDTEDDHADALREQTTGLGVDPALLDAQANPVASNTDHGVFYLWPDNQDAFAMWQKCQSQWVIGLQGAEGLNYAGVETVLRRNGYRGQRLDAMFEAMQHLETGARQAHAELRSRNSKN